MNLDRYAKAIAAAVLQGLGTTYTALLDGVISGPEYVLIASSVVGSLVLVWGIPNAPMPIPNPPNASPVPLENLKVSLDGDTSTP